MAGRVGSVTVETTALPLPPVATRYQSFAAQTAITVGEKYSAVIFL